MTPARATLEAALADAEAVVERLRDALAELDGGEIEVEPDDEPVFEHHDLIDTAIAAARAGVSQVSIRNWVDRDPTLGFRRGTRYRVSSKRLTEIIRGRDGR